MPVPRSRIIPSSWAEEREGHEKGRAKKKVKGSVVRTIQYARKTIKRQHGALGKVGGGDAGTNYIKVSPEEQYCVKREKHLRKNKKATAGE